MTTAIPEPVVHLELRTDDPLRASAFYTRLFGWRSERLLVEGAAYLALGMGRGIEIGVVERAGGEPSWLPYIEVTNIVLATGLARDLGAAVLLGPREGPAGWRSVLAVPAGAEIALWQPKA